MTALYLFVAYSLLIHYAGIGACDGSGCSSAFELPGFLPPNSTLAEFDTLRIQLLYRIPHFVIALVFTLEALAANAVMNRFATLRKRRIAAILLSLLFLSLAPLISDLGTAVGVWRQGQWFVWNDPTWMFLFFPMPVLLPLAVLVPIAHRTTEFLTSFLERSCRDR